jgi:hypothetical protein
MHFKMRPDGSLEECFTAVCTIVYPEFQTAHALNTVGNPNSFSVRILLSTLMNSNLKTLEIRSYFNDQLNEYYDLRHCYSVIVLKR